jgi:hypothetical protein
MEGFSFVTPVTGLSGNTGNTNTGKEDDDEEVYERIICIFNLNTMSFINFWHC